jgi:hypothetical protein
VTTKGEPTTQITKWQTTKGTNQYNTSNNKKQKNSEAVQVQITTKQRPNQQNAKGTAQDKGSAGTSNQLHLVPALEQSQKSLETAGVPIEKTTTST